MKFERLISLYIAGGILMAVLLCFANVKYSIAETDDEFAEFQDPDDLSTIDLSEPIHPSNKVPDAKAAEAVPSTPKTAESDWVTTDEDEVYQPSFSNSNNAEHIHEAASTLSDEFEDSHFKDDEEFEGLQPDDSVPAQKSAGFAKDNKPDLIIAKVPHHLTRSWDNFHLEFLLISLLSVYIVTFFVGRAKNIRLAQAWFSAHKELLKANFSLVGDDGLTQGDSVGLVKESEHCYTLWCSGRSYCEAMLVELRLIRRQCLISLLSNWLKPAHDSIVVKVIMDDGEMDGWVMAVGRKRRLQALVKDHMDLATYCPEKRGQRHPGLPDSLVVLNEAIEATNAILNPTVCKFLADNEDTVDYLFFSDQYTGPKPSQEDSAPAKMPDSQKALIFAFRIGTKATATPDDMEALVPLFQLIFYVIEKVRRIRLSKEAKIKSERSRQRAYDTRLKVVQSQRQEAAQTRREERMRAVKERIMAEDDPEKARKLEEKEQRREKSKKQPRMKMVKVKGM